MNGLSSPDAASFKKPRLIAYLEDFVPPPGSRWALRKQVRRLLMLLCGCALLHHVLSPAVCTSVRQPRTDEQELELERQHNAAVAAAAEAQKRAQEEAEAQARLAAQKRTGVLQKTFAAASRLVGRVARSSPSAGAGTGSARGSPRVNTLDVAVGGHGEVVVIDGEPAVKAVTRVLEVPVTKRVVLADVLARGSSESPPRNALADGSVDGTALGSGSGSGGKAGPGAATVMGASVRGADSPVKESGGGGRGLTSRSKGSNATGETGRGSGVSSHSKAPSALTPMEALLLKKRRAQHKSNVLSPITVADMARALGPIQVGA